MKQDYAMQGTGNIGPGQLNAVGPYQAVECKGERSTLETMDITADRLERIESFLYGISVLLFGSEPCDNIGCPPHPEPSVRYLAGRAFESSARIDRQCEEIRHRLAGN